MSGYKMAAISITSEEYDRLFSAENEVKAVPEPYAEQMEFIGDQSVAILQTNLKGVEARQEAFDSMLSEVNENIREIETRTGRALVEFQAGVVTQTQQYIGTMWQQFDQVIAGYTQEFDQRIRASAQETQETISDLYRSLRQMAASTEEKAALAAQWLDAAEQYCVYIKQYFNYEQFTPGRVEWLERQLEQAQENMEVGLPEVVIASAQQLVLSFSDLRIELERAQNEWVLLYQSAWEAINRLLIQIDRCLYVEAVDLDGNLLSTEINVDYWCGGRLRQMYSDILLLRSQMENEDNQPDRELLRRWLENDLVSFRKELEDIVFQARINALNSQLRINIADLVVQALQEQGFALEESDYTQNDMRMAYGAHLANLEGNQIIIQVAPVGEQVGENELHVQSMDSEQRTEHELEQRWFEISRSLNHFGVEVSQYTRLDAVNRPDRRAKAYPGYLSQWKNAQSGMKASRGYGYRTGSPDHTER